jgi:dihydrolipoamide dehydrogenase
MILIRSAIVALFAVSTSYAFTSPLTASKAFVSSSHYSLRSSTSDVANETPFDFDVAIIGCGVGGHGAALHARSQSLQTAVFAGGDVGGTCVNRGCVPSKALLAASGRVREMQNSKHLSELGIAVEGKVTFEREGIASHARSLAQKVKGNLESSLVGLGVQVIEGRGILTGKPHEIQDSVTGKIYTAKVSGNRNHSD